MSWAICLIILASNLTGTPVSWGAGPGTQTQTHDFGIPVGFEVKIIKQMAYDPPPPFP